MTSTTNEQADSWIDNLAIWGIGGAVGLALAGLGWLFSREDWLNSPVTFEWFNATATSLGLTCGGLVSGVAVARHLRRFYGIDTASKVLVVLGWTLGAFVGCCTALALIPVPFLGGPLGGAIGGSIGGAANAYAISQASHKVNLEIGIVIAAGWAFAGIIAGLIAMLGGSITGIIAILGGAVGWALNWGVWGCVGGMLFGFMGFKALKIPL